MQCDQCGERPAAIHLTQIEQNKVVTVHLCEVCAAEKGVQSEGSVAKYPLSDFLASMGKGETPTPPGESDPGACEFCGATLQDFRESGRLGCPHCYETFEAHLRALLRRIHGASRHVGEVYLAPAGAGPGQREDVDALGDLRQQLKLAVEAENFELAAELRDRIRRFE